MYYWILKKIKFLSDEHYTFWVTLGFYITVWLLNPGNKILILFFLILFITYNLRIKKFRTSLLILYLASIVIYVGKKYTFELLPPGIFPSNLYPNGYVDSIVFSARSIVVSTMILTMVCDLFDKKIKFKINIAEMFLILYFFWIIITDIFISKKPEISIPFSILSLESALESLVVYFYICFEKFEFKKIVKIIFYTFIALTIFEALVSLPQFLASSPTGNNLESQKNVEYFGDSNDELSFRFRPIGTFPHANISGMWFSFMITILISAAIKFSFPYTSIALLLGIITIVMTLSRGAWIGTTFSSLLILFIIEKMKRIKIEIPDFVAKNYIGVTFILVIISIFFIFPRLNKSLNYFNGGGGNLRNLQIKESVNLIMNHPFFGVGTAMAVQEGYSFNPKGVFGQVPLAPHIWYILITVEHGIPALTFFLTFVILSLEYTARKLTISRFNSFDDYFILGLFAAVTSLFLIGFFQPFVGLPLILLSFALIKIYQNEKNIK